MARDPLERANIKSRGQRLQQLRVIARLTQKEAAEIAQVSLVTYRDWEYGKHPIPMRRIRFITHTLKLEGILCDPTWVSEEVGEPPRKMHEIETYYDRVSESAPIRYFKPIGHSAEEEQMKKELAVFYEGYSDAVDLLIQDDAMMPLYAPNDLVAGIKCYGKEILKLIGKTCIIQRKDGGKALRILQSGVQKNHFTLLTTNPHSTNSIEHEVELEFAAPVIWQRKHGN